MHTLKSSIVLVRRPQFFCQAISKQMGTVLEYMKQHHPSVLSGFCWRRVSSLKANRYCESQCNGIRKVALLSLRSRRQIHPGLLVNKPIKPSVQVWDYGMNWDNNLLTEWKPWSSRYSPFGFSADRIRVITWRLAMNMTPFLSYFYDLFMIYLLMHIFSPLIK